MDQPSHRFPGSGAATGLVPSDFRLPFSGVHSWLPTAWMRLRFIVPAACLLPAETVEAARLAERSRVEELELAGCRRARVAQVCPPARDGVHEGARRLHLIGRVAAGELEQE